MTAEDEVRQLFARLSELAQDETLSEDDATVVVAGLLGVLGSMLANPAWRRVMARTGTPPPGWLRRDLAWPQDADTEQTVPVGQVALPRPRVAAAGLPGVLGSMLANPAWQHVMARTGTPPPGWLRRGRAWPQDADTEQTVPVGQAAVPRPHEGGIMAARPAVLAASVHGAGRSPMAAALLDHYAAGRVVVRSAGTEPADTINPAVIKVMGEKGFDLSKMLPNPLTTNAVRASDLVIIMGCGDGFPFYPGKHYLHWDLEDPAGKNIATVRRIRDDIDTRIRGLLTSLLSRSGSHRAVRPVAGR